MCRCVHEVYAEKSELPENLTFEQGDYIEFMPYVDTDQFRGRCHRCLLCEKKVWSCWGNADKHWQSHGGE